jgi:endoglucanase
VSRVVPRILWGVVALLACAIIIVIELIVHVSIAPTAARSSWPNDERNTTVFAGGLWVDSKSLPAVQASQLLASGQDADAAAVATIAREPIATWLTGGVTGAKLVALLKADLADARRTGTTAVFVTYAIPERDCGDYSSGGMATAAAYERWNQTIATTLASQHAVVLVEPDSIAMLGQSSCGSITKERLALLATAAHQYARARVPIYLDGGNSHWQGTKVMASRLRAAGVQYARGFFTNVSNFYRVDQERSYADHLSALVGNKHFVIDVSRDGAGSTGSWCNPPGAALGQSPHVSAGTTELDALLWVKTPGASDGTCSGGPAAGHWFGTYALALVANRRGS